MTSYVQSYVSMRAFGCTLVKTGPRRGQPRFLPKYAPLKLIAYLLSAALSLPADGLVGFCKQGTLLSTPSSFIFLTGTGKQLQVGKAVLSRPFWASSCITVQCRSPLDPPKSPENMLINAPHLRALSSIRISHWPLCVVGHKK